MSGNDNKNDKNKKNDNTFYLYSTFHETQDTREHKSDRLEKNIMKATRYKQIEKQTSCNSSALEHQPALLKAG